MSRFFTGTLLLSLSSAMSCAAMMARPAPTSRPAENPLVTGQALELKHNGEIGVVAEQDCTTWPFEDTLTVSVNEAQICITSHTHKDAPPGWSGEPTMRTSEGFQVANDANEGGYININKTHVAKVGACFNKGYNAKIAIWAFDYHGCAPNNGTVTAATRSLRVGRDAWEFAPTSSTAPSAPTVQ